MSAWLDALLRAHLTCDLGAMVAFWAAASATKGGRLHTGAGAWFRRFVYAAGALGGLLAVIGLASPGLLRPGAAGLPPAEQAAVHDAARQSMWLVLYILVILVAPVHHGLAVVRAGPTPSRIRTPAHTALAILAVATGLAFGAAAVSWHAWTELVIAPIGPVLGLRQLAYGRRSRADRTAWQREHLTSLLAAGIVLHTALVVFGTSRTLGMVFEGAAAFVPWVLPAAIGLPVIVSVRRSWTGRRTANGER